MRGRRLYKKRSDRCLLHREQKNSVPLTGIRNPRSFPTESLTHPIRQLYGANKEEDSSNGNPATRKHYSFLGNFWTRSWHGQAAATMPFLDEWRTSGIIWSLWGTQIDPICLSIFFLVCNYRIEFAKSIFKNRNILELSRIDSVSYIIPQSKCILDELLIIWVRHLHSRCVYLFIGLLAGPHAQIRKYFPLQAFIQPLSRYLSILDRLSLRYKQKCRERLRLEFKPASSGLSWQLGYSVCTREAASNSIN